MQFAVRLQAVNHMSIETDDRIAQGELRESDAV
jgi:hypothetical protein